MDQCISRSSVSPSPAASYSYSLSPTSNPGNLTSNATPIMSSLYLGQNQRHPQQQQQQQQQHNINEQNLIQQQQQQQQQFNTYATLNDHLGNLDYSSINSNLLTGDLIDNSTQLSIDLESLLVNTTLSDSHILISGPPSCSDSTTANNPNSENDLNNQLSDSSLANRNNHIISNLSNSSSNSSAHNDDFNNDDNVNNNINPMFLFKNVNIPNAATNLAGVNIDYNNNSNAPNNTMNIVNINTKKKIRHMTDMTYNSSPSSSSSSSILHNRKYISNSLESSSMGSSNQTSGSGSDSLSSPKSNASSSSPIQFSSSMKKQQRIPTKIDEEELHANQTPSTTSRGSSSSIRNLLSNKINFQQQQQQQQQQQHLAMSLPSGSYLMSKFNDQNLQQNQPQIYNQSNLINRPSQQQQQQQQQVNEGLFFQQGSDPVLTQLVLNNTSSTVSNPNPGNVNVNYQQQQQQPMLSALPNRLNQQKQQQQYLPNRKVNFFIQDSSNNNNNNNNNQFAFNVANNSMFVDHNQSNQMISMSLPANYNSQYLSTGGFVDRKSTNNNERVQIKQEFIDDESSEYQTGNNRSGSSLINSNFKNVVDDNDDKFSRLKLSSPLSSANSQLYGGNGSSGHPSSSVSPNLEAINSSIFDVDNNGVNDNADIDVIAALAPSLDQSRPIQQHHHVQASLNINDLLFNSKTPSPSPANTKDLLSDMNDNEMGVNAIVNELKIAAGNSSSGLIDIVNLENSMMNANEGNYDEDYDDEDEDDDLEEDDDEDDDDDDDLDDDDDEDIDDDDNSSSNKKPNIQGNNSYVFANTNNPQYMFSSTQPSKSAKKQEKFYVGSVGSSLSYLNKRNHAPINSRKHARTNNSSGVDVHTMNSAQHRQQQDVFSNFQFAPFNSSGAQQQQNQSINIQFQQPAVQQQQQQTQFISTSLPPTSAMDSMMMIKLQQQPVNNAFNMNNQFGQQQQTVQVQMYQQMQQPQQNNHPNLNKLLLNNNNNNNTQKLSIPNLNNSQMYSSADTSKRTRQASKVKKEKKSPSSKEEQQVNNKKRHKKQQDLFDDDFEPDEDEDDDDEDEDFSDQSDDDAGKLKSSIKMEADDYESEDSGESNMTATNKAKKSSSRGGNNSLGSASNSFANSDTLFDLMMSSKNRDSYFWQYNIQSKGPKTKKVLTLRNKDPHLHRDFFDPVFQLQSLNARGGTALNKLRKGDGNDVTPNADKLYNLGNQIRDFIQKSYQMNSAFFTPQQQQAITGALSSSSINQLGSTPTNSHGVLSTSLDNNNMPPRERMNLKREKNKIASRACRLKKKAQHEANKIKLSGLNDEHSKFRFDRLNVLKFDLFFFERMFFLYDRF